MLEAASELLRVQRLLLSHSHTHTHTHPNTPHNASHPKTLTRSATADSVTLHHTPTLSTTRNNNKFNLRVDPPHPNLHHQQQLDTPTCISVLVHTLVLVVGVVKRDFFTVSEVLNNTTSIPSTNTTTDNPAIRAFAPWRKIPQEPSLKRSSEEGWEEEE